MLKPGLGGEGFEQADCAARRRDGIATMERGPGACIPARPLVGLSESSHRTIPPVRRQAPENPEFGSSRAPASSDAYGGSVNKCIPDRAGGNAIRAGESQGCPIRAAALRPEQIAPVPKRRPCLLHAELLAGAPPRIFSCRLKARRVLQRFVAGHS
jgi:hypothetical protein